MITKLPYKIIVEESVKGRLLDFFKEFNSIKSIAIICGKNTFNIVGEDVKKELEKEYKVDIFLVDSDFSEKDLIEKLANDIKGYDIVIGIGGGRNIDIAKYSSLIAKVPWVAFPTVLSHDGVVSSRASIKSNGKRISIQAQEPMGIIIDLEVVRKAPYRNIAAGFGDLISNIIAVEDWKLAAKRGKERYHTLIGELSLLSARAVIEHVDEIRNLDLHGLEVLAWSLICSGFAMNIYGSSRPCSGSEHNFSHALDELGSNALHGEQCALGTIIMSYLHNKDWKEIRDIIKRAGLPTSAKEIGISEDILVKALVIAKHVRERYTILDEVDISEDYARRILKEVEII
ncbi:MAG: iron-containing alcohol dehydrogenase [Candidatus Aenigmatarchaeota archaeon]